MSERPIITGVADPAAPPLRLTRSRSLLGAVGILASAGLLWLSIRGIDGGEVGDALAAANVGWAVLAVALMMGFYWLQAERWAYVGRREGRLSVRDGFLMVVGATALNNVLPARPGELARAYWFARRTGARLTRSASTVVADRAADFVTLLAMLVATAAFVPQRGWVRAIEAAAAALLVALVVLFALARRRARSQACLAPKPGLGGRIRWHIDSFADGLATTSNARDVAAVLARSVVVWGVWCLSAATVAGAVGMGLSPGELVFTAAIMNLGVAIPSSPGFVGTYQWLGVSALALFGVPAADALAFTVILHAVWFVPTTILGLGTFLAGSLGARGVPLTVPTGRSR